GMRHALAAQAQPRAAVGAGRDRERDPAVERRDLDARAERRLGDGHREGDVEVAPLAAEEAGRPYAHARGEVAGGRAAAARRPLAAQADAPAVGDARRDPHRHRLLAQRAVRRRARDRDAVLAAARRVDEIELDLRLDVAAAALAAAAAPAA